MVNMCTTVLPYHHCTTKGKIVLNIPKKIPWYYHGGYVLVTLTSTWYFENTMVKSISVSWYMLKYHSITITLPLYYLKGSMVKNNIVLVEILKSFSKNIVVLP